MKLSVFVKVAILFPSIILFHACCKPGGVEPSFPIYSYTTDIVNPPDYFQVNYIVSAPGAKTANITFDTNSVWIVEKLGDTKILYSINNGVDNKTIVIRDTIGFQANKLYKFTANNTTSLDITNFLVKFAKTSDNYDSYPNKF